MDWLRSEDLKEEKMVAPHAVTIPRQKVISSLGPTPSPACWLLEGIGGTIGRRQEAAR
jgi:hypothetical protein